MDYAAAPSPQDLEACVESMRGGSKTFFAASRVLPARVAAPAAALYAFCREADDAIDLSTDRHAALADLRLRLDAVYAGAPRALVSDRALAFVVQHARLPRLLLEALLEGFAWDAEGRRYDRIEDLHAYGARVAGTVGAMMALVMGTRDRLALARACELGVAMQLTNIARDVGEDARAGRLYLPLQWLREEGIDAAAWLREPIFCAGIARVVQRLLAEADRLYARAESGVAALPRGCRPAIQAARLVYAEIGREVEAAGLDSVTRRAVVSAERKAVLMARAAVALLHAPGNASLRAAAPLGAVDFLVSAAAAPSAAVVGAAPVNFYRRTVRTIELFESLVQRQREAFPSASGAAAGGD
jgi:15-cis-phytoene synthase